MPPECILQIKIRQVKMDLNAGRIVLRKTPTLPFWELTVSGRVIKGAIGVMATARAYLRHARIAMDLVEQGGHVKKRWCLWEVQSAANRARRGIERLVQFGYITYPNGDPLPYPRPRGIDADGEGKPLPRPKRQRHVQD
jgi:hypothetical protein